MRTRKSVFGALAALALLCAAGCCETEYLYIYPDGRQVLVKETPAPARPVRRIPVRRGRWGYRNPGAPVVAPAQTETVVVDAAPVVPATPVVDANAPVVLQRGRKGRIVCYKEAPRQAPRAPRPVVVAPVTPEPVVVPAPIVVSAPVVVEEPVAAVVETEQVAVEEPSWTQYLAPEQPAVVATEQYYIQPQMIPAEQYAVPAPVYAVPAPVAQGTQQPIVVQPIIQPVVQPYGSPYVQPFVQPYGQQPYVLPLEQPVVQTGQEVLSGQIWSGTPETGLQTGWLGTGGYAPQPSLPFAMPYGGFTVCGPGQNCFTLSESQLQSGPQVITPDAAGALTRVTPPPPQAQVAQTMQQIQVMPQAQMLPQTQMMIASTPFAPRATLIAPPPAVYQDKYDALAPVMEPPRPVERPEVTMPAPLGGTTIPPVAGTAEIENALDVMMGNASPTLK